MQCLKHQTGRAGRTDIDRQVVGRVASWPEAKFTRADCATTHLCLSQRSGSFNGLEMLRPQAGFVSIRPNLDHPEWSSGQQ
jgi:hypothetical protein